MCIGLCVVNAAFPWAPAPFGLPKRTGRRRPATRVFLQPDLEAVLGFLVWPPDPALHLLLHAVECVPFDQGPVGPQLHAPVRAGEAAIHGIGEDVRDRLTCPRTARLRPMSEAVPVPASSA